MFFSPPGVFAFPPALFSFAPGMFSFPPAPSSSRPALFSFAPGLFSFAPALFSPCAGVVVEARVSDVARMTFKPSIASLIQVTEPRNRVAPSNRSRTPWVVGIVALALLLAFVSRRGELLAALEAFGHLSAWSVLVAFALQAASYVFAGLVWREALHVEHLRWSLRPLVKLALAKLMVDRAFPSGGASGSLLVYRVLKRRGATREAGANIVLFNVVAYFLAYGVAVALAALILWSEGIFPRAVQVLVLAFAAVFMVGAVLTGWLLAHPRPLKGRLARRLGLVALTAQLSRRQRFSRPAVARSVAYHLAAMTLDTLTLWVLLYGLGEPRSVGLVFAAGTMALAAGTLSIVPAGLGVFEATSTAMLSLAGVSVHVALAATLLGRLFTFWLPILPGVWLARRLLAAAERPSS